MAWWRYNAGTRLFEISNDNGATFFAPEIDAAIITHGQVAGARLPPYIAYKNVDNNWIAGQTFPGVSITGSSSSLSFYDTTSPADQRFWRFINYANGNFYLDALNDAGNAYRTQYTFGGTGTFTAAGINSTGPMQAGTSLYSTGYVKAATTFYEKGRNVANGQWIDVTSQCSYGNITVTNASVTAFYMGDVVWVNFRIDTASNIATTLLYLGTPFVMARRTSGYAFVALAGNYLPCNAFALEGGSTIQLTRATYPDAFPASGSFTLHLTMPIALA